MKAYFLFLSGILLAFVSCTKEVDRFEDELPREFTGEYDISLVDIDYEYVAECDGHRVRSFSYAILVDRVGRNQTERINSKVFPLSEGKHFYTDNEKWVSIGGSGIRTVQDGDEFIVFVQSISRYYQLNADELEITVWVDEHPEESRYVSAANPRKKISLAMHRPW